METYNDTNLRLLITDSRRFVHFDLIFTEMYFMSCEQTIDEANLTQSRIMNPQKHKKEKGPIRSKQCKVRQYKIWNIFI